MGESCDAGRQGLGQRCFSPQFSGENQVPINMMLAWEVWSLS